MLRKNGAKVFIKNKSLGKYLFQLRDDSPKIVYPNMYGLLGGGVEEGENPIDALARELSEESNIEVSDIEELGVKTITILEKEEDREYHFKSKIFFFLAQTNGELSELELYEGQRLEYFTIEEALALPNLTSPTRKAINEYKTHLV